MKKKILTIALTLIFCCMGLFTFAGCEKQSDYHINVTHYPTSCGKFIPKGDAGGIYDMPYEYIDALCSGMVVECYDKDNKMLWSSTGMAGDGGLRAHGGSVSINVNTMGTHTAKLTVIMEDGTSESVEWDFTISGSAQSGDVSTSTISSAYRGEVSYRCSKSTATNSHNFYDTNGDGLCDHITNLIAQKKCGGTKKTVINN